MTLFVPFYSQNSQKCLQRPPGVPEPGGLYLQNLKIRLCYHKTQLLSVITNPVNPITKSIITNYANVAELKPPTPIHYGK